MQGRTDRDQRYATALQLRTEVLAVLEASYSIRTHNRPPRQPWLAWTLPAVGGLALMLLARAYLSPSVDAPERLATPGSAGSKGLPGDAQPLPSAELEELLNAAHIEFMQPAKSKPFPTTR